VRSIVFALAAFLLLVTSAMFFASRVIEQGEKDERTQSCAVDGIDGVVPGPAPSAVHSGQNVQFRGWAADLVRGRPPLSIDVELVSGKEEGVIVGKGKPMVDRPDVAALYKKPALTRTGFSIPATISVPHAGNWDVHLRAHFPGREILCYSDKVLRIDN
jgi:hypothetical protein